MKYFVNLQAQIMNRKTNILLILCCLAFVGRAVAQFDDPKTLEIGPHVGASYYIGDINPAKHFWQSSLQYGGVVRLNWDNRWTFRFDYSHATVQASDEVVKWRPERGLNFRTTINDFSIVAEFNFVEYYTGNPKKNMSPYIFGGISVFHYTPYAVVDGELVPLRDKFTEAPLPSDARWYEKLTYKDIPVGLSIPFGVGLKFALSRHMAGTVEWRLQKTFTDYLDDVKGVYPGADSHAMYGDHDLTDPSGNYEAGQQRGNASFNDWFGMARVSLTWKINLPDGRGCNLSKF